MLRAVLQINLSALLNKTAKGKYLDIFLENRLRELIDDLTMPLQVMIMGEFSVGKSTFINAMLQKEVAIASPIPTTAVITKFVYGSKDRIIVHFLNGKQEEFTPEDFNKLTVENNGKYKKMHDSIKYVERQLPNDLLKQYNFIDSPGRNAIVEKHEEVTQNFVENADAMLWLFSVDQMGGKTEKEILQSFSERLKPIAIVNKMDLVDDDDELEELIEELKLNFKDDIVDVVPISAEYAVQGSLENNKDLLKFSNINKVYDKLQYYFGNKQAYLKVKKLMQAFVPILDIIEEKALQTLKRTFFLDKKNYEQYINRLQATVQNYDDIGKTIGNIEQLCTEAISKKELLKKELNKDNVDYFTICHVSDNWTNNCRKLIGSALYFAIKGNVDVQYEYAQNYYEKSPGIAEYWLIKAGEGGCLPAQQTLYSYIKPAGYWFEKAAQNGDEYAILQIALSYFEGQNGIKQNLEKAAYWLKKAVNYEQKGVNAAKCYLACLYVNGVGVKQDYKKAYDLVNKIAKAGYGLAMILLAALKYKGWGTEQNKLAAFCLWFKGGSYDEIEKYFVKDNFDLHKKIAELFSNKQIDANKEDSKYSSAYFWYKLDFEHNGNVDSAYQCGNEKEKEEKWLEALYWYAICAEREHIDSIKKAGDICYYKLKKSLKAVKYYIKGWRYGDKYCRNMVFKYLFKKGIQLFAIYALLSILVHIIGIHLYSERNKKIEDDNYRFTQVKNYLDDMKQSYQKGIYRIRSEDDEEVKKFESGIKRLKQIYSDYEAENQNFHKSYDNYANLDKYFLFSDYVIAKYFTLANSPITDEYNDDYYAILNKMLDDEEKIHNRKENALRLEKAQQERKEQQEKQKADLKLHQNDINDATRAFLAYHDALSNHNFDKAYDMLTSERQNGMGTPGNMADGYRNTLESNVTDISCNHIDDNEAVFDYRLKARDRVNNSPRVLVQYFKGQVHMFKNNGKWRVGYNESEKVTERYE